MSRGDGRALEAAARAQWERFAELEGRPEWGPDSQESTTRALWENLLESTEAGITAYLDALLSELPEEALRAAEAETEEDWWVIRDQVTAFLLSLRSPGEDGQDG